MPDARLPRTATTLAAIAAAYCAASWLGVWLSREAGNVAAFWPADGLLLGILLRRRGRWAATLGACAGIKLALKLLLGSGLIISAGFIASNMLQVAIALALLARLIGLPLRLTSLRELAAFALAAGVVAPAIGASTAALMLHGALGAPFWLMWRTWWISGAVGMLLVAPAIAACDGCLELRRFLAGRRGHLAAAELAAVVSLLVGGRSGWPQLRLPEPVCAHPALGSAPLRHRPDRGSRPGGGARCDRRGSARGLALALG